MASDPGCHPMARLYISRRLRVVAGDQRARGRPICFLEAKRRDALVRQAVRNAGVSNVLAFPTMRLVMRSRCHDAR